MEQALARTDIFLVLSILSESSDNDDSGMATDNFNVIFSHKQLKVIIFLHVDIFLLQTLHNLLPAL